MAPVTRRTPKSSDERDSDDERRVEDEQPTRSDSAAAPSAAPRDNLVGLTEDQMTRLITGIMLRTGSPATAGEQEGSAHPTQVASYPTATSQGNFSRCTARFDGAARSADEFEAFLDGVLVFKECASVSDEHALRGMSMLLTGEAAVWWRGTKSAAATWDEAVRRLRAMYGAPRPAHTILREIFAQEQGEERAETFISRARANLSRLPYSVPKEMQVDIVYGLLNRKLRKRVTRDSVSAGLDCLLERARHVEESLTEVRYLPVISSEVSESNVDINVKKCPSKVNISNAATLDPNIKYNANSIIKRVRPRCVFCKRIGHSVDECKRAKSKTDEGETGAHKLSCYGCGRQGVIRSKCPNCRNTSLDKVSFHSVTTRNADAVRPVVKIEIESLTGAAVLDTGATESLASPGLYKILVNSGTVFSKSRRSIGLADGTRQVRTVLICDTIVTIRGRNIDTTLLAMPEANNRTLLGQDFITQAGILLDLPHSCWYFSDRSDQKYPFMQHYTLATSSDAELMQADTVDLALREDEGSKLSPPQRMELNQLIVNRAERFATEGPPTTYATHRIRVSEEQEPTASPPYRMSQGKKELLDGELEKLLRAEVIEECESPWAANVVLVSKKDGGVRLCVDYRKLNAVTEPDRYPLPRLEDVLHAAKTTSYMTTLDLHSGYFQVCVAEEDRDKTAFITPSGTFRFIRMPMGLRNSGATFQRLIDRFKANLTVHHQASTRGESAEVSSALQDSRPVTILGYLDDLIILSPTFEEHIEDLGAVFGRLEAFNLRVNRKKSCFACDSVKFLGHIIVPGGLQVDPGKTSAIAGRPAPKTEKQLKGFLATSSWFRRFIPGYASIAKPLTDLLKKNSTWQWESAQQAAFERIKELLITAPILRQADESKPFSLMTDSSGYCLGAVLMQGEGPDERPVEYASRLLEQAERNYSTTEREALAVVWAVTKFRGYIECSEVVVKSDHQPLRWLMNLKAPSGRLARWALTLQAYNLQIQYTPGRSNVIADALSRPACCEEGPDDCEACEVIVDIPHENPKEVRENQLKDPELRKIIEDMESDDLTTRGRAWSNRGYILSDGVLYRYGPEAEDDDNACLVVPLHEREKVLSDFHDAPTAGHLGAERTLQRIRTRYFWPGMRSFVSEYVKQCVDCQRYKANNRKPAGLLQTPASTRRFEVMAVDLFGPLPKTIEGNRWILIIEDVCTHWVELFALKSATSTECAEVLISEVFLRFGVPRRMISDNGVQFVAAVMQQACHVMGIKQSLTPLYHPEANPVERKNRDLKPQLAILVGKDHSSWDTHLAAIRFAMNTAVTASTGFSPAFLTFGREIRAPSDVVKDMRAIAEVDNFVANITPYLRKLSTVLLDARDAHERAQAVNKRYADEGRRPPPDYKVGDLVLIKTQRANDVGPGQSTKFIPRRDGPYRIKALVSPTTFVMESIAGEEVGRYHVSHLTPFVGHVEAPVREKRRRGRPRKL